MRAAAALLGAPPDDDALYGLARAVGFTSAPDPLAADAREALGLPPHLTDVRVARGYGTLRALLVRGSGELPLRECVTRIAACLARRTPHLLWLVVADDEGRGERTIASWSPARVPPRTAALTVERVRITASDAETLCALAAANESSDLLTHARWLDVLGRDALTRRFYRTLEGTVATMAASATCPGRARPGAEDRRTIALLTASRLLFLAFLEAKGWLDGDRDYLVRSFSRRMADGGAYHRRVLEPLFFGTLNTRPRDRAPAARALGAIPYLNGGLFTRTALERQWRHVRIPDEALGTLFDELLTRYRLTARENQSTWSDAAIDPEMLGKAFESLMAPAERRTSGAYYTPHALVERTTSEAIAAHLRRTGCSDDEIVRLAAGEPIAEERRTAVAAALKGVRVLDPACGSGAFLVHALERLSSMLRLTGEERDVGALRRAVLTRSIFGVDANPTAVWLCELRLWLSTVIECEATDVAHVPTLPNLDHNIHVGDSLAGSGFDRWPGDHAPRSRMSVLRSRYARSTGARKRTLGRLLERTLRQMSAEVLSRQLARVEHERRALVTAMRQRDLFGERRRSPRDARELAALKGRRRELRAQLRAQERGGVTAFAWPVHFADVAAAGGFDIVVGNPPWVRLHNIPREARERLRRDFAVYAAAAWEAGAAAAGAGRGFAAQVDLAALFAERCVRLLRPGGSLALLLPAKLWKSLAGGGVRRLLVESAPPTVLEDWSESAAAFDAAVYPSLLVATVADGDRPRPGRETLSCAIHHRGTELRWQSDRSSFALDETPGSPWIIAPPDVRAAFDRMRRAGRALGGASFGRPLLGVKCGLNEAFIVDGDHAIARSFSRPLVRGESVTPWRLDVSERILWTHDGHGAPFATLPDALARHLGRHRRALLARSDVRGARAWWSLFRVESADASRPRVVWGDVGRAPRAAFVDAGDDVVPLNSCYVLRCAEREDALAMTSLLNSPLVAAWLSLLAEPARGGYRRYLGWTMASLPIPADWTHARALLAPAAEAALDGRPPSADELMDLSVRAYRVRRGDVAPLVTWVER